LLKTPSSERERERDREMEKEKKRVGGEAKGGREREK
jgi:hypothetical protein